MVYALEIIAHGLHHEEGSDLDGCKWSTKTKQAESSELWQILTSSSHLLQCLSCYLALMVWAWNCKVQVMTYVDGNDMLRLFKSMKMSFWT